LGTPKSYILLGFSILTHPAIGDSPWKPLHVAKTIAVQSSGGHVQSQRLWWEPPGNVCRRLAVDHRSFFPHLSGEGS
jgi:hypothetical protein